ncbi:hypothetical protein CGCF415_v009405 [Colletotrichum fructicola]|nr:hypothetical protein CGCF415_v009405 [Colletotrichum fructicola]KAF4943005.1 hypothetical protein CGCF245_v000262 [Colletotrichum fructicola]
MSHASSEVYEPPVVLCAGNWRITRRRHSTQPHKLPTIQTTYQWRRETDGTRLADRKRRDVQGPRGHSPADSGRAEVGCLPHRHLAKMGSLFWAAVGPFFFFSPYLWGEERNEGRGGDGGGRDDVVVTTGVRIQFIPKCERWLALDLCLSLSHSLYFATVSFKKRTRTARKAEAEADSNRDWAAETAV